MLISIVVPTYNRKADLERCIESVLAQSVTEFELIVIDDASTDNTIAYLAECAARDARLTYRSFDVNRGVNSARNKGVELAKGEYILFLDSDDYLTENALAVVLAYVQKRTHKHYLFLVSDRQQEALLPKQDREYTYADWLQRNVYGDFTHVLEAHFLRKYRFFEEYRAFENLNWLRVFRDTSPQLFVSTCICVRDRNRTDSLTVTLFQKDKRKMGLRYAVNREMIEMYEEDYGRLAPAVFQKFLIKNIMLGMVLGQYRSNGNLLRRLKRFSPVGYPVLSMLNSCRSGWILEAAMSTKALVKPMLRG